MRGITVVTTDVAVRLVVLDCYTCGTPLGMAENLERRFREDGTTFYCPNGHGQAFTKSVSSQLESTRKRLERERAESAAREGALRDQLQASERSRRGLKAANTRVRNRLKAGQCPCCEQRFDDVAEHIAAEHPDFELAEQSG